MSAAIKQALRHCPNCGNVMSKSTESWVSYSKKTACSAKCAAILREAKERNNKNAAHALENAIRGWRIAA